ncbi:unnamed protein product, partial [Agarophyton chilense]
MLHCLIAFLSLCVINLGSVSAHHHTYLGHWEKTWNVPSTRFKEANLGFAFSGNVDIGMALGNSSRVYRRLRGAKFITIGGGNKHGWWTRRVIADVDRAIRYGRFDGYRGIAYDIEEGDSGLRSYFERSFRRAKRRGFAIVVTISRTAPYQMQGAGRLMRTIIRSRYVDILSPIMYPSELGFQKCTERGGIDYQITRGVEWEDFASSR